MVPSPERVLAAPNQKVAFQDLFAGAQGTTLQDHPATVPSGATWRITRHQRGNMALTGTGALMAAGQGGTLMYSANAGFRSPDYTLATQLSYQTANRPCPTFGVRWTDDDDGYLLAYDGNFYLSRCQGGKRTLLAMIYHAISGTRALTIRIQGKNPTQILVQYNGANVFTNAARVSSPATLEEGVILDNSPEQVTEANGIGVGFDGGGAGRPDTGILVLPIAVYYGAPPPATGITLTAPQGKAFTEVLSDPIMVALSPVGAAGTATVQLSDREGGGAFYAGIPPKPVSGVTLTAAQPSALVRYRNVRPNTTSGYTLSATNTNGLANPPSVTVPVAADKAIRFVCIGDSITYGDAGPDTPGAVEARTLAHLNGERQVEAYLSCTVGGISAEYASDGKSHTGYNGMTSGSWTGVIPPSLMLDAITTAKLNHCRYATIMLGTNDAGFGIPAEAYGKYMQTVCRTLTAYGIIPILNYPPFRPDKPAANALLQAYQPQIDALCDNKTVFQGDRKAYTAMAANCATEGLKGPNSYFSGSGGPHPNKIGAEALGRLWAAAFYQAFLRPGATNGAQTSGQN